MLACHSLPVVLKRKRTLSRFTTWVHRAVLAVVALALVQACAIYDRGGQTVTPDKLPPYRVELATEDEPAVKTDGYEWRLRFNVRSRGPFPYSHLIQEIRQTAIHTLASGAAESYVITLVETFRLSPNPTRDGDDWVYSLEPFQRDKHFESGFEGTNEMVREITIKRDIRLYTAVVEGADFTLLGFAHLPGNKEGSIATAIPANFNRTYQESHKTQGRIVVDDRERGSHCYGFEYSWRRSSSGVPAACLSIDPDRARPDDTMILPARPATAAGAGENNDTGSFGRWFKW